MSRVSRVLEGRRITQLLAARISEQAVLGIASLALAARLGPASFAPISALIVINSISISLSDFGLGIALLSGGPKSVSRVSLRTIRLVNAAVMVSAVVVAMLLGGRSGVLVAVSGVLWATSAEAYVRKSLRLSSGGTAAVARLEVLGSTAFGISAVLAFLRPGDAVGLVSFGLVAKQVIEMTSEARPARLLADHQSRLGEPLRIWLSQAASTLTANADYFIVGAAFGASAFSLYSLAFRVTSLVPSQVSAAAQRVVLDELGPSSARSERSMRYQRRLTQLFVVGAVAAFVMVIVGLLAPFLLSPVWDPSAAMVVVLAFAIPWRTLGSLGGAAVLGDGRSHHLLAFEVVRLVAVGGAYVVAAAIGLPPLVVVVAIAAITSTVVVHRLASQSGNFSVPIWFWWASVVGVLATVLTGLVLAGAVNGTAGS